MRMLLKEYLEQNIELINQYLDKALVSGDTYPSVIHQSMRYSVFAGGKRLRPILTLASCQVVGGKPEQALPTSAALELIHTYSLIHDDLPAMDNDDYRRGQLTNHKVFGEAVAILAGDGLLTYAFKLIAKNEELGTPAPVVLQIIKEVSDAAGSLGMVGGQVVDMESENKPADSSVLEYIHSHKTGALFKAAVRAGALIGGANSQQLSALDSYAYNLGLAFQITDDILDVEGDAQLLGKPIGSDIKNKKSTYPSIYGMSKAKEMAVESVEKAKASLSIFGSEADVLAEIVDYLTSRKY